MGAQEKNDRIGTYDRMAQRLSTASTSWVGRGRGWGGGQVQAQGQAEGHGQGWDWFLWDRKVCVRGAFGACLNPNLDPNPGPYPQLGL